MPHQPAAAAAAAAANATVLKDRLKQSTLLRKGFSTPIPPKNKNYLKFKSRKCQKSRALFYFCPLISRC